MKDQQQERDALADLALCEAATPEPWVVQWQSGQTPEHLYTHEVCLSPEKEIILLTEADAAFIAAARTALPYWIRSYLSERERSLRAEAEAERLRKALAIDPPWSGEWEDVGPVLARQDDDGQWRCGNCGEECNYQASGHYDVKADRWLCKTSLTGER